MEFGLNFCIYFFFNDLHWAGRLVMGLKILEGGLLRLEFGLNFCIYPFFFGWSAGNGAEIFLLGGGGGRS